MSPKVYLRKEQTFKKLAMTDRKKPKLNDEYIMKWQNMINIVADIIDVAAALILKVTPDSMEVLASSESKDNPYKVGDSQFLGRGLYCETVIGKNEKLYIKNALENDVWKDIINSDFNMISYYGLPINWPDEEPFGTICILNSSEISLKDEINELFNRLRGVIQEDLAFLMKQQELNNFFNLNLDLLCIANTNGSFIKVNRAWEDLLGYEPKVLEEMKFLDFIHPEDLRSTENAIRNLENNEKVTHFINRFRDSSGNYHSIEWHSQANGKYIYAAARDITDKVLQREAIKNQKKRLDWIIEGTDAGTWEWNIRTDETTFNNRFAEMLGYALKEISPMFFETLKAYTHPDDFKKVKKELKKHFDGLVEYFDVEVRMRHKRGHWIWMNSRGKVISWTEKNEPYKMFGTHINISKRKEKENKLVQTRALIKNLMDQAPGTIYQFKLLPNGSYCFPYASKGIYKIYEVTANEVKDSAEKAFRRIHPDDYQQLVDSIEASAKDLSRWHDTYRVVLPKQGLKWLEGEAVPEKLSDGSILWHGSNLKITKQKNHHLFKKTLAEISSSLLKINSTNIDDKINESLRKIGEFFSMDRSYIFQVSQERNSISNTHEWCRSGIDKQKEQLQNLKIDSFPWAMSKLKSNKVIIINDVENMGLNQRAEENLLKTLNLKSVIAMPIFIESSIFGFFGFDSVKNKKKLTEDELRLLKIFTDVITSAFSKYIFDKKILKLTYHDSLTGLYNRRFFENELLRLNTKRQLPISIIIADINGLKIINDSLGHEKGDKLLIKSANILKSVIREEDILARQGGDEFAILLPATRKLDAEKIIKRIKAFSKGTKNQELTVSMALGTASKTKVSQSIYEVLKKADNNMYQNKLSESKSAKSKIVKSLLNTLEVKSFETKEHAIRMTEISEKFGERLELSNSELNRLSLLSTLHDIGKTTIAEEILKKNGKIKQ